MDVLSTFDPTVILTIGGCIWGIISTGINVIQKIKAGKITEALTAANDAKTKAKELFKAFQNLMNPSVPMDAAQAEVMKEADPKTWTMPDATLAKLWKELRDGGANLNFCALEDVVRFHEKTDVEYGLLCLDNDRQAQTNPPCAFISYGNYTIGTEDEVIKLCLEHGNAEKTCIGC